MENNILLETKKKFSFLLYYLISSGFTYEYIEHVIIHNDYFNFFENNDLESFLDKPIEDIIENVFKKRVYIDYYASLTSEIIWAGEMYITIFYNLMIPIQRIFLIMPIIKMLSLFNPYHEMNEYQLCQRYLEEENKVSILKALNGKETNLRKLSFATGINERTLRSYIENKKIYGASLDNIYKLMGYYSVPVSLFAIESNFCPSVDILLEDEEFRLVYSKQIIQYLSLPEDSIILYKDNRNTFKVSNDDNKVVIELDRLIVVKKNKVLSLNESEAKYLKRRAIKEFKLLIPNGTLLF